MEPVLGERPRKKEQRAEVSFLTLAEIVVVSAWRKREMKLDRLRRAHDFVKSRFHIEYPFAHVEFKTDGAHMLMQFEQAEPGPKLLAADMSGQEILPGHVVTELERFDFEAEFAARWFPISKDVPVVIDPRYAAGKPSIVGRGVTVETLYKHWRAGQEIDFIAEDYELDKKLVELVLQRAERFAAWTVPRPFAFFLYPSGRTRRVL